MATPLLSLSDISLTFGGDRLLNGADLEITAGAKIALLGRNGSGKSTLLKVAAGIIESDGGERFAHPRTRVTYLAQEPEFDNAKTAQDYLSQHLYHESDTHRIEMIAQDLGFAPELDLSSASGGEARRVAIAGALLCDADILLLDEPTNHLDLPTIEWLENYLRASRSAIVTISHDRRFLENLASACIWIDRGQTRLLRQGFSKFEAWRDKLLEDEKLADHKLDRKIAAEEDWLRYGVTARRKRNVRRLRDLHSLRDQARHKVKPTGDIKFSTATSEVSGKRAIVVEGASKSYDGRKIVSDFSIEINRGDRIGVVGPNGAGKSTLVNILTGALTPDDGDVHHGSNIQLISLDQKRAALNPEMRLADAITDGRGDFVTIGDNKRHVSSYLQDFLFKPEQWRTPVSSLSGGERGRLALAVALSKPSNLLALDEPTNDLDLETLDLLEEVLSAYDGTLLLISHDRSFLDRLVTSVLAQDLSDPSRWVQYPGGFDDMVEQRAQSSSASAKADTTTRARKTKPSREPETKAVAKKLSYKEQYALETLPSTIAELEAEAATLEATLSAPQAWDKDPDAYNAAADRLSTVKSKLEEAEEQWLGLEMKREALQSQ